MRNEKGKGESNTNNNNIQINTCNKCAIKTNKICNKLNMLNTVLVLSAKR